MHTVGPPHPWTPNRRSVQVFAGTNSHVSGLVQFTLTLILFKGQLYSLFSLVFLFLCSNWYASGSVSYNPEATSHLHLTSWPKKKKGYPIPWTARKMALTPSSVASCSSPRGLTRIMKAPVPTCPEAFYHDSLKSYLLHDTLQMAWSGALSCSLPSRCGVSSSIIACGTVFSTEHKLLSPASLESELLGSESGSATYCYDSLCKLLNPLSIK